MNNYWMLILLLQVINVQCAEIVETSTIEIINEDEGESNDHFVGEIATDKNSMAYLAQHYGVDRAHNVIFNNIIDRRCSKKVIEKLVNHYKLDISGLNYSTLTLLIYACYRSDAIIFECLLNMGADPEVKDEWIKDGKKFGGTALHWACEKRNVDVVGLLVTRPNININSTDAHGATPLHWACRVGSPQIVAILIKSGANTQTADEKDVTPLHLACGSGNLETVMKVVKAGGNLQAVDENNDTPLHYAYRSNINMVISYIKRNGADGQAKNKAGLIPSQVKKTQSIHEAPRVSSSEIVQEENAENVVETTPRSSHKKDNCVIS